MQTVEAHSTSASNRIVTIGKYVDVSSSQTSGIWIMHMPHHISDPDTDYANRISSLLLSATTCWQEMPSYDDNISTETFGSKYHNASYIIEQELIARNRRRASLLRKQIDDRLTHEESAELEQLQSAEESRLTAEMQPAMHHLRSLLNPQDP